MMTERQMFEASFHRPKNYFRLPARRQYEIDAALGILDWEGDGLSEENIERFHRYYEEE